MDDHHLNYIKLLERKALVRGNPSLPLPLPPKLRNICHISFFQYFSILNPCFNFMNCNVFLKKIVKITLKKKKKKSRIFTKSFAQNKIALSNQFIT